MATPAQIAANRANASKSTGPRSQEGKQTSSRNATKHGLYSDVICLPGEDQNAYNRLRDDLYLRHRPVGELEASLVDRILLAMWKLKRALAAEAEHYKRAQRELTDLDGYKRCASPADVLAICLERTSIPAFERMQVQLQRMMDRALAELRKVQKERREREEQESEDGQDENCGNEANSPVTPVATTPPNPALLRAVEPVVDALTSTLGQDRFEDPLA